MMKKFTTTLLLAGLSAAYCNAAILVNDSFDYTLGNLASQGTWVYNGSFGSDPINVIEKNLTFPDYQDEAKGKAIRIDGAGVKNSVENVFAMVGNDAPESVFYSALINVEAPITMSKYTPVIALVGYNSFEDNIGDGIVSTEGGGLFLKKGSEDDKVVLGVCAKVQLNGVSGADISWSEDEFPLNQTILVVVKHEMVGEAQIATLYINPGKDGGGAAAVSEVSAPTLRDIRGVAFCQRNNIQGRGGTAVIDELRVATEWSELFETGGVSIKIPTINVESSYYFGEVFEGVPYKKTFVIKGSNLEGDIAISVEDEGVELSTETISKEDAESEEGAELTITLLPTDRGTVYEKITFSSSNALSRVLNLEWRAVEFVAGNTDSSLGLNITAPADAEFKTEFIEEDLREGIRSHYLITIGSSAESVDLEIKLPEGYDSMLYRYEGNDLATRAAGEEASTGFTEGKVITITPDGSIKNYSLIFAKAGMPDAATVTNLKIKTGLPTGVCEIGVDVEDAVFFTFEGLKVDKPEKGPYLMVKNGKAVKVIR